MLRDKNLIPLSHQHQHALALCVRIERASPIPQGDVSAWEMEVKHLFESEIEVHFGAEEQIIFPAAEKFDDLRPLVQELIAEHSLLRAMFAKAKTGALSSNDVLVLAQQLSTHIRKEERQLFERMQQLLSHHELMVIGGRLDTALKNADQSCMLPSEATRLRSGK
jgi:hemerythrin-like domain-containing protein